MNQTYTFQFTLKPQIWCVLFIPYPVSLAPFFFWKGILALIFPGTKPTMDVIERYWAHYQH